MKLGFVGTGAITSAIVTGLNADGASRETILVSPRNTETATALAAQYENVTVVASNQAVLDGSDVVMLAVRPQVAVEALSELRFRRDHHVISLLAILPLGKVAELVAPAARVTRAVPLPMVADRCGPTGIYPPDPVAAELFNRLGTAIEMSSADQFDAFCTATATMAPYFAFADEIATWLARHGVPASDARRYIATVFQGLGNIAVAKPQHSLSALAGEFATRGGLNEQVMAHLKEHGSLDALSDALDAVLRRIKAIAV